MAKRSNLTTEQIVQYLLQSGGDISTLKNANIPKKQLLAAVLSSPQLVASLQQGASQEATKYAQYDPSAIYNPSTAANTVQLKYMQMGEKYQPFLKDFWDSIAAVGGNPIDVAKIKKQLDSSTELTASKYGLNPDEISVLTNDLYKDIPAFTDAEVARQKSQYAAFNQQRSKVGISSPETATSDYLAKQTGIQGLADLPTSLENVAASKAKELAASLAGQGKSARFVKEISDQFYSKFLSEAKKKKVSPTTFGAAELVKRNILGK